MTAEQNLTVRINKSEAELTNNERLRSRNCTVDDNYWQTASRGLSATAELLVDEYFRHQSTWYDPQKKMTLMEYIVSLYSNLYGLRYNI